MFAWLRKKPETEPETIPVTIAYPPPPFCEDCAFYRRSTPGPQFGKCAHPRVSHDQAWTLVSRNVDVTSDMKHCATGRDKNWACGPEGRLFEAAPKPEPPKVDSPELVALRGIQGSLLSLNGTAIAIQAHAMSATKAPSAARKRVAPKKPR